MGIRFQCPNGHKLNVKADLAGKRAVCPSCGVKIVVPIVDAAEAVPEPAHAMAGGPSPKPPSASDAQRAATTPAPASVEPPPAPAAATPAPAGQVWYVRPSAGGQFGPATEDVFRGWIADGRVAADAYVWREGWPEWKLARDAADALPAPLVATPVAPAPAAAATAVSEPPDATPPTPATPHASNPAAATEEWSPGAAVTLEGNSSPAARYVARRRRSRKTQFTLAVLMLVAVLVLAGILVWVLWRDTTPVVRAVERPSIQLARTGDSPYVAGTESFASNDETLSQGILWEGFPTPISLC